MSSITIISIPSGQAPDWVREKWVGIEIPLPAQESGGHQMGVLGGKATNEGGYQVETAVALARLSEKSREAAVWFMTKATLGSRLVFAKEVCKHNP